MAQERETWRIIVNKVINCGSSCNATDSQLTEELVCLYLVGLFVSWLVSLFVCWLVSLFVYLFVSWLVGWFVGLFVG